MARTILINRNALTTDKTVPNDPTKATDLAVLKSLATKQFPIPPQAPTAITLSYQINWIRTLTQVSNQLAILYPLAMQLLQLAHIANPSLDCSLLLSDTLQVAKIQLWQLQDYQLSPLELRRFWNRIFQRLRGCPVAKILHRKAFWQADFQVNSQVLDPRADSESLIELALAVIHNRQMTGQLLELGVGSGCLLLSLLQEFPQMQGVGVDLSPSALQLTALNAADLHLTSRVALYLSDLFEQVPPQSLFQLIISNPPYIPTREISQLAVEVKQYDPILALDGGNDGLEFYRKIATTAAPFLAPHGWLLLECGDRQATEVKLIMKQQHWQWRQSQYDLRGVERALAFQYIPH